MNLTSLRFSGKLLKLSKTLRLQRTFLSEAYQCQEAWDKRMDSELLKKINPIEFFLELDQKFQGQHKVHAVDIDIFAHIIKEESHVPEIADLLYKLRMTKETTYTLDSTHHAVVRYYLSVGKADELISILNDRLNYGIFCDYFDYNLLMDYFIKQKDFASAAKTATYMMLQEQFEHPISNALAIYSCSKYLENPDSWQEVDPKSLVEEPKEEVKIRVKYIRNPYFDDHFDLWQPSHLVGKTLYLIGRTMDNPLGRSCILRGLILHKKYKDAISLLKKWKEEGAKEVMYKDLLPFIKNDAPEISNEDATDYVKELQLLLKELENADLHQGNWENDIEAMIKKAVEAHAKEDISRQTKLYSEWESKRMEVLNQQLTEIDKLSRLAKVKELKQDLVERERLLTFFENEEKIELEIEEKLEKERQMYGDENKSAVESEENYISPDIIKKRNK